LFSEQHKLEFPEIVKNIPLPGKMRHMAYLTIMLGLREMKKGFILLLSLLRRRACLCFCSDGFCKMA